MANTIYSNTVIGQSVTDILTTTINARNLMTIDNSLAESAGMTKQVNTYTYNGTVDTVTEGNGNTNTSTLSYVANNYPVKMLQQKAEYTDEDAMKDANVIDMITKGATDVMANKLTADFYDALAAKDASSNDIVSTVSIGSGDSFGYDVICDAVADMNIEDESKLFLIISPEWKALIRKDADYKTAQLGDVVYNGMIGTVAGIPVIVSKALTGKACAYVMTQSAVTCFMKKEVEVEQDRNADKRLNDIYMRTAYVIAVTDATKVRKIA